MKISFNAKCVALICHTYLRAIFLSLGLVASGCAWAEKPVPVTDQHVAPPIEWPLRDGDVWVMVGDSITAQKLHTNYLEAFVRARYPRWKLAVVNSGVSGDTLFQPSIHFNNRIAAYKPTLVSLAFGANDHRKWMPTQPGLLNRPKNPAKSIIERSQALGARVIFLSPSPVNAPAGWASDGGKWQWKGQPVDGKEVPPGWFSDDAWTKFVALYREYATDHGVPYVDQYSVLRPLWQANVPRDRVRALRRAVDPHLSEEFSIEPVSRSEANKLLSGIRQFLNDEQVWPSVAAPDKDNLVAYYNAASTGRTEALNELRAYLLGTWIPLVAKMQPLPVQIGGSNGYQKPHDNIHPGPAGHLMMAAVLFKQMGAEPLVSAVTIDAKAVELTETRKAKVRDITFRDGVLSFKRLDESVPLPVPAQAREALLVDGSTPIGDPANLFGMSRYMLTITGLLAGRYELRIDNVPVATMSAEQLASGFDAGLLDKGPLAEQGARLLQAVDKNLIIADNQLPETTVAVARTLDEAQPQEHVWTLRLLK